MAANMRLSTSRSEMTGAVPPRVIVVGRGTRQSANDTLQMRQSGMTVAPKRS
jgi:hypothetical protein